MKKHIAFGVFATFAAGIALAVVGTAPYIALTAVAIVGAKLLERKD